MSLAWVGAVLAAGALYKAVSISSREGETIVRLLAEAWPPGPHLAGNSFRALASLLFVCVSLILHDAAGTRLFRFLLGGKSPGGLRATAALVSYLILSFSVLGLSACGLAYPAALAIPFAGIVVFALPRFRASLRLLLEAAAGVWRGMSLAAGILATAALVWCLPLLLAPETSVDGLVYHLTYPQQLLAAHRLFGTEVLSHWALPFVCEMPYVYPLLLGLDPAARLTGLVLGFLGAVAFLRTLGVGRSHATCAGVGALSFLVPASAWTAMITKNDVVVCACVLGGSAALIESGVFSSAFGRGYLRRPSSFFVSSLLLGSCVAMKYVTVPVVGALGAAAVAGLSARYRARALALGAAGLLIPFLPWAAKSWFFLNDPVYPLGLVFSPKLFGDPAVNEMTRELFEIELREFRPRPWVFRDLIQLVSANACGFLAGLPVIVMAATGFLVRARPLIVALLLGLAAQLTFARVELEQVERYAYAVFVALNACGLVAVFSGAVPRARVLAIAAWVLALACLVRLYPTQEDRHATAYLAGRMPPVEYRRAAMFGYGALLPEILEKTGGGSRASPAPVLSVGEILFCDLGARALCRFLETPFIWRAVHEADSVERLEVKFRQAGARWMLYNSYLAGRWRYAYSPYAWDERMLGLYLRFARTHMTLEAFCGQVHPFFGSTWLYSLGERARPAREILFLPGVEASFAFAGLAHMNSAFVDAVSRFGDMRLRLPGLIQLESLQGSALLDAGEPERAYRLLARAARAGYADEDNYFDLAVAAALTGRRERARAALARARSLYPLMPGRLAEARARVDAETARKRTVQ